MEQTTLTKKLTSLLTSRLTKKLTNNDLKAAHELKPYKTKEEVDLFYRKVLYSRKHEMVTSEVDLFTTLIGLMKSVAGVAFISQKKLAEYAGQSYATVRRNLKRLEDKGVIAKVHADKVVNGIRQGNGNCYYVLLPEAIDGVKLPEEKAAEDKILAAQEAAFLMSEQAGERAEVSKQEKPKNAGGSKDEQAKKVGDKGSFLSKLPTEYKDKTLVQADAVEDKYLAVYHFIPKSFAAIAYKIVKTPEEVYKLFNAVRNGSFRHYKDEELETFAYDCIRRLFVAVKFNKIKKDPFSLLYGIAKNVNFERAKEEGKRLQEAEEAERRRLEEEVDVERTGLIDQLYAEGKLHPKQAALLEAIGAF